MTETSGLAVPLAAAATGVVVYFYAWRAVVTLPLLARMLIRLLLAGVVLVPMGLLILRAPTGDGRTQTAGRAPDTEIGAREDPVARRSQEERRSTEEELKRIDAELEAIKRDRSAREQSSTGTGVPAPPIAQSPSRSASQASPPQPTAQAPAQGLEPRPAPAPPAASAKPQEEWDVVPVFFGTDRAASTTSKRPDYTWERGRRLELGRALVTVPRLHQVPQVERPWALRLPYLDVTLYEQTEDPARHFTMREVKALTRAEFLELVTKRLSTSERFKEHALVFVHGYNTAFDAAVYRTAQISYDLKFDGASFLYTWPSGGKIASYTYDRESAGQSEPYLREFVDLVVKQSGAKSVSIIAHSMGNQPLLQVLRELKRTTPSGVAISQVILAAPDVDRDNFENLARAIEGLAKGVTLYAAANDRAMGVSRRFHGGVPRAGDVPEGGPLVVPGVDTIDVTAASMESVGLNHSAYAENDVLLKDVARLVATGERPPDRRSAGLEKAMTARGAYWRYVGAR